MAKKLHPKVQEHLDKCDQAQEGVQEGVQEEVQEVQEEDQEVRKLFDEEDVPELVSTTKLRMTKAKAIELREHDRYNRQRHKKQALLKFLRTKLLSGLWHGNKVAIAELDFDHVVDDIITRKVVVNGGHFIYLCATEDMPVTDNNQLLVYRCKTPKSLACLYNQFDRSESSRSSKDQYLAFMDLLPDVEGWDRVGQGAVGNCAAAVCVVEHGLSYRNILKTAEERTAVLIDPKYYEHALFLRSLLYEHGQKQNKFMMKAQPVMSVIVATHMINPEKAAKFWKAVRDGVDLKPDSPELTLRSFLLASSAGGGSKSVILYTIMARCHQAWNAFINGKKLPSFSGRVPVELPPLLGGD